MPPEETSGEILAFRLLLVTEREVPAREVRYGSKADTSVSIAKVKKSGRKRTLSQRF